MTNGKCLALLILIIAICTFPACQSTNNVNSSPSENTSVSPQPEGISTSPIPPGGTPTPGIADVNAQKKVNQPSGTPPAGIPDLTPKKGDKSPQDSEKTTPSKGPIAVGQGNKRRP